MAELRAVYNQAIGNMVAEGADPADAMSDVNVEDLARGIV